MLPNPRYNAITYNDITYPRCESQLVEVSLGHINIEGTEGKPDSKKLNEVKLVYPLHLHIVPGIHMEDILESPWNPWQSKMRTSGGEARALITAAMAKFDEEFEDKGITYTTFQENLDMKLDGGKMSDIFDKVETKMVQATPDTTTGKLPTHARSSRYISSRSQCPLALGDEMMASQAKTPAAGTRNLKPHLFTPPKRVPEEDVEAAKRKMRNNAKQFQAMRALRDEFKELGTTRMVAFDLVTPPTLL